MAYHAPNRNPCESSFRMIDKRISLPQRDAMNELDLYLGVDEYFVCDNGEVEIYTVDSYYCTFKRDGTMSINPDNFRQ